MDLYIKIICVTILITFIDCKPNNVTDSPLLTKDYVLIKNGNLNESKIVNIDNKNKSNDLLTSDQNYNYVKEKDTYYDNNNGNKNKSFLREVHYFHNREVGYEKDYHWNSDYNKEYVPKKVKKDLYNKRNYGNNYGIKDDIIEIKKWDDNEKDIHFNYNNDNRNNYMINTNTNRNPINYNSNINHNIKNQIYSRNDGNKDNYNPNDNYKRKHVFEGRVDDREGGYDGSDNEKNKWFINIDDSDADNTDNEVKDEDNYNNYNSPKFVVNFQKFKPWNRIMNSDENYDNYNNNYMNNQNNENNYEIHSNSDDKYEGREDREEKFNYRPTLLTDLTSKMRKEFNNDYNNYKRRQNDRDFGFKMKTYKEMRQRSRSGRSGPKAKAVRYHYEKRVYPQIYSKPNDQTIDYDRQPPNRDQLNRMFIEKPFDMFNTGWSSSHKPLHRRSDANTKAKIMQYRYGF